MLKRCSNPHDKEFKNYGDRGIKVCERWKQFVNFLSDMGEKPPGFTLERINNDGNYEPDNCRWATRSEQMRNTRRTKMVVVRDFSGCILDACKHFGISYQSVWRRMQRGISLEDALTIPPRDH
jgi:hypothetical protein